MRTYYNSTAAPDAQAAPRSDTAAALAFLKHHTAGWTDRGWFVQVVAIQPARDKDHKPAPEAISVSPSEIATLGPWIEARQGRAGLYFAVNPLQRCLGKKALKADIAALAYLHADLDPREGEPLDSERARILEAVKAFPVRPTALINSGNGLGAFWHLDEPLPTDANYSELENTNIRIAHALGADHCHNLDRVMRLPGTINLPDWQKCKKGRVPVAATLLWQNETAHTLEDFSFLPPAPKATAHDSTEAFAPVDEVALAARLQAAQGDPELAKLLQGEALHWMKDPSRSGFDFALARVLHRLGFTADEIAALLLRYEYGKAMEQADCVRYITSIIKKVKARAETSAAPGLPAAETSAVPGFPAARHLTTDQANAERLHRAAGGSLMFSAGRWYIWTGVHWSADEAAAYRQTCNLSALILDEAAEWEHRLARSAEEGDKNKEIAEALRKWAKASEMKPRLDAAFQLLRKLVDVPAESLDADPYALNVANGTVDLRTGRLRQHDKGDLITRIVRIAYDPDVRAPLFEKALAEITGESGFERKPIAEFLQRWFGYSATGLVIEQAFAVHHGAGANGKSKLLGTIERVLGPYAMAAAPSLLVGNAQDRHPTEIADLRGMRVVTAYESTEDGVLREEFVKRATGGDRMKARFMRQDFFEFAPTHKLQLVTNHKPQIRGQEHAIWRRVLLIPYNVRFGTRVEVDKGEAHHVKDEALGEKLKAEDAGILAWIVRGAVKWQMLGLNPPDVVLAAGRAYREEQDRVGQFITECCERDPDAWTPLSAKFGGLYSAYKDWALRNGYHALGRGKFQEALEKRPGIRKGSRNHDNLGKHAFGVGYHGLRVLGFL